MTKWQYDEYRQWIWNLFVSLVGEHDSASSNGQLSRNILQSYIDRGLAIMQQFSDDTTKYVQGGLDWGWVSPRFYDYANFITGVLDSWKLEINTIPYDFEPATRPYNPLVEAPLPVEEIALEEPEYLPLYDVSQPLQVVVDGIPIEEWNGTAVEEEGEYVQTTIANNFDLGSTINAGIEEAIRIGEQQAGNAITQAATKANYDVYRQRVWTNFQNLIGQINQYRNAGQLDRPALQQYIDAIVSLMADFKRGTDGFIQQGLDSNWVSPRFHDFYDFMAKILNELRTELATMPSHIIEDILGGLGDILGIGSGGSNIPPPYTNTTGNGLPVTTQQPILASGSNLMMIGILGVAAYFLLKGR